MKEPMMPQAVARPESSSVECETLEKEIRRNITEGKERAENAITAWTDVLLYLKGENGMNAVVNDSAAVTYDADVASGAILHEIDEMMGAGAANDASLETLDNL